MKKIYFSENVFRNLFLAVLTVLLFGITSSCKDRDEDPNESYTVQFVVQGTSGVTFKAIVVQVGTVQSTKFNVAGTSWTSDSQIVNSNVGAVHLSATGSGIDVDSKLTVKILVNGEVKAENSVTGANLVAKTMVDF